MKKLFEQATQIAIEAQMIADSLAEYNPGLSKNKTPLRENRTSLIILATDAGILAREFEKLRVSLRNKHEENQRNDIDSDS
jgi:hypothetical protein